MRQLEEIARNGDLSPVCVRTITLPTACYDCQRSRGVVTLSSTTIVCRRRRYDRNTTYWAAAAEWQVSTDSHIQRWRLL